MALKMKKNDASVIGWKGEYSGRCKEIAVVVKAMSQ